MGVVYYAQDERLARPVAIKLLDESVEPTPGLLERLKREARVLANINHPHICTLYDVGNEGGRDYLVLEYLEGETLDLRLRTRRVPTEQAVLWAIQIADALDTAHRRGIVHRDLKPSNIILTQAGVKLLDFGLAKDSEALAGSSEVSADGALIGTYAYMAPEQASAGRVDARSDLFSLGVILHEMLSGNRLFGGDSVAATLTAVLTRDAAVISPPRLNHIVQRCLAKDPDERWQTARDVMLELETVLEGEDETAVPAKARYAAWVVLCVLLAAAALFFGYTRFRTRPVEPEVRLSLLPPNGAVVKSFAVSPDGLFVAIAAEQEGRDHLWIRSLISGEFRQLPDTEGGSYPFWSPQGREIGFFAEGKLKKISTKGGVATVLCDAPLGNGGTWNSSGEILFTPNIFEGLYRVRTEGGLPSSVTERDRRRKENSHRWPQFLPDGYHFLFTVRADELAVYLGDLRTRRTRRLVTTTSSAIYVDGQVLFTRGATVISQRLDLSSGTLTGDAVPMLEGVAFDHLRNWTAITAGENGTILFQRAAVGSRDHELVFRDRNGIQHGTPKATGPYLMLSVRPDASSVALHQYNSQSDNARTEVWILNLRTAELHRAAFSSAFPVWSRDGRKLLMMGFRNGAFVLYWKEVDGQREKPLFTSPEPIYPLDWTVGDRTVLFQRRSPESGSDIYEIASDRSGSQQPVLNSRANEEMGRLSRDGRWLAYVSDESGTRQVYVKRFPSHVGDSAWQVSTQGGTNPGWSRDGKQIYYVAPDSWLFTGRVIADHNTFRVENLRHLFLAGSGNWVPAGNIYEPTRDGAGFWFLRPPAALASTIDVLLHWRAP
jgi:Tol biopolymer transport system component